MLRDCIRGYTCSMKTAISIPDTVYEHAEQLAHRLGKSRSQLYSEAVAEYVARHDPEAMTECFRLYGQHESFSVHDDPYDATMDADALVLVTEWKLYWVPDFERLAEEMRQKVLLDGRNIWSADSAVNQGFVYHAIGRASVTPQ